MENIYLLCGEDSFRLSLKLEELKKKISKKLELIKPKEEEELISLVFSVSLFRTNKLILLDLNKVQTQELENLNKELKRQKLPKEVFLFFYKEGKLDRRLKVTKELEELADHKFFLELFSPWKTKEISDWIKTLAKDKNLTIESKASFKLAEFYKNNTSLIGASLDLLDLYFDEEKKLIDLKLVEKICKQEANLFLSIDLLLEKNFSQFQLSLKNLLLSQSSFQILAALQNIFDYFLDLKDLVENLGDSPDKAAKKLIKHPFKIKQDLSKLRSWSFQDLFKIYENLNKLESLSKSGKLGDLAQGLRFLFARL